MKIAPIQHDGHSPQTHRIFCSRKARRRPRSLTPSIALAGALLTVCADDTLPQGTEYPLSVRVEATTSEDATAAGLRIDKPFSLGDRTLAIAEIGAAKGDADFGIISAGLALRRSVWNGEGFVGVHGFYDALQDSDGFSYSQVGFGAMISRGRISLSANGYLPVGDYDDEDISHRAHKRKTHRLAQDAAGNLGELSTTVDWRETTTVRRTAGWSWDVELGVALLKNPQFFDPRIAVGYYQVGGAHSAEDYSGVLVRGEMRFGHHFMADVEWRQDGRGLGQEWIAGVSWTIPLGRVSEAPRSESPGASTGKAVLAMEDSKEFKSPRDGKRVAQPAPEPISDPPGFADPVNRSPWPTVLRSRTTANSPRHTSSSFKKLNPNPDDCNCTSGPPLIFD